MKGLQTRTNSGSTLIRKANFQLEHRNDRAGGGGIIHSIST